MAEEEKIPTMVGKTENKLVPSAYIITLPATNPLVMLLKKAVNSEGMVNLFVDPKGQMGIRLFILEVMTLQEIAQRGFTILKDNTSSIVMPSDDEIRRLN